MIHIFRNDGSRLKQDQAVSAADLAKPGALAALLSSGEPLRANREAETQRWKMAVERFSWDALRPSYEVMFREAAVRSLPRASKSPLGAS